METGKWYTCSECGSDNVHCDIGVNSSDAGLQRTNYIVLRPGFIVDLVAVDLYVCGDCGNVKTFVSNEGALRTINEKWPRADEVE